MFAARCEIPAYAGMTGPVQPYGYWIKSSMTVPAAQPALWIDESLVTLCQRVRFRFPLPRGMTGCGWFVLFTL